jgi:hypothetical protein
MNPPAPRQFAVFRVLLGVYLAVHFWSLVPYAGELFSTSGMLPDASVLPTAPFPNPLATATASGAAIALSIACALALAFAAGVWRRPLALLLWFGWACLFNRNPFIANPSIPYVGWLLLACAIIPNEAPLRPSLPRPDDGWAVPKPLYVGAWLLLGLGYTLSGLHKLASPSWRDGSALRHVIELPLARETALRDAFVGQPNEVLAVLTYGALIAEITALPLFAFRATRPYAWWGLVAMQLGILCLLDFADLTLGMLAFHAFVADARWLPARARRWVNDDFAGLGG